MQTRSDRPRSRRAAAAVRGRRRHPTRRRRVEAVVKREDLCAAVKAHHRRPLGLPVGHHRPRSPVAEDGQAGRGAGRAAGRAGRGRWKTGSRCSTTSSSGAGRGHAARQRALPRRRACRASAASSRRPRSTSASCMEMFGIVVEGTPGHRQAAAARRLAGRRLPAAEVVQGTDGVGTAATRQRQPQSQASRKPM